MSQIEAFFEELGRWLHAYQGEDGADWDVESFVEQITDEDLRSLTWMLKIARERSESNQDPV